MAYARQFKHAKIILYVLLIFLAILTGYAIRSLAPAPHRVPLIQVAAAIPAQVSCGTITSNPKTAQAVVASIITERCFESALSNCFPAVMLYRNTEGYQADSGFETTFDPSPAKPTDATCTLMGWSNTSANSVSGFDSFPCSGLKVNADKSLDFYGCGKEGDIVIASDAIELPNDGD